MPIDFPNSPALNDTYSAGGKTWYYDGTAWTLRSVLTANGTISNSDLADDAVTASKISNSAVTSAKIADGTIVNADVASNAAIATTKITGWEDDQVILSTATFL